MTFKMGITGILAPGIMLSLTLLNCIQDPADRTWRPEDENVYDNNYYFISSIVQDSNGIFYGGGWNAIYRFDSSDCANNDPPEEIAGFYEPLLHIDITTNRFFAIAGYGRYLINQLDDTIEWIDLSNSSIASDTLRPLNMEDGILWLATKYGEIYSWDGKSIKECYDLWSYDGIKTVFPEDSGITIFTYNNFILNYYFFKDYERNERTIHFYYQWEDSCILYNVFRLDGRFFIVAEIRYENYNQLNVFEMNDYYDAEIRASLPSRPGNFLQLHDTMYIKGDRYICIITPRGYRSLNSTYDLEGPIFLDCHRRPTLFYTPTRRMIHIDSLPGYYPMEW